jgi:hypothetical protein
MNAFNKQSQIANKKWSPAWGVGRVPTLPTIQNHHIMKFYTGLQTWKHSLEKLGQEQMEETQIKPLYVRFTENSSK